jgi:tryptophan 2,3-dioxygenase
MRRLPPPSLPLKPSRMTATPAGMTYADYLKLDTLLSAQHPISDLHDEMLFVIIHQTKELWLKQMLHEVGFACRLVAGDKFSEAYKALSRVSRIWTVMTLSWDVLATLTPVDYSAFRDVLGTSSGFQSAQFRELEYRLGIKDPRFLGFYEGGSEGHARLEKALAEPSLWDEANAALVRAGFSIEGDGALKSAWLEIYRRPDEYFGLYQLAEKLVDLDDALAAWRHKHMLTVERIIGMKTGTGGSAGAAYLATTLSKRAFPELWALRTEL